MFGIGKKVEDVTDNARIETSVPTTLLTLRGGFCAPVFSQPYSMRTPNEPLPHTK